MAKINRLSGIVSGKIGNEVYYGLYGEQKVRKAAGRHKVKNTTRWIDIKAVFAELSGVWRELPEDIKALWEMYARTLGSPSRVERNKNVSYRFCPIPNYPPRPKNIHGREAFISANCRAYVAGLDIPLLYPPLGASIPPPPDITCAYDHKSAELAVKLTIPNIAKSGRIKVCRILIWITAFRSVRGRCAFVVQRHLLDRFDIPADTNQVIEKRYVGIKDTGKNYRYKNLLFGAVPYLRIYIGAQMLIAIDYKTAPTASCGSYLPYWILNKPKYIGIEDLLQTGELKNPGNIKFGEHFKKYVEAKRRAIARKEFADIKK